MGVAVSCKACEERGQTWSGSPPKCAFEDGIFNSDNWNCATMNKLRDLAEQNSLWSEDQNCGIISNKWGKFIVLSWYKRRGRTEGAWIVDETEKHDLTIKAAEEFINSR